MPKFEMDDNTKVVISVIAWSIVMVTLIICASK